MGMARASGEMEKGCMMRKSLELEMTVRRKYRKELKDRRIQPRLILIYTTLPTSHTDLGVRTALHAVGPILLIKPPPRKAASLY